MVIGIIILNRGIKLSFIIKYTPILIGVTFLTTIINIVSLEYIPSLFIPLANYLTVVLVWLYRGFDSIIALSMAIFWFIFMLFCFSKLIFKKKMLFCIIFVYALDFAIVLYMLISTPNLLHCISAITDLLIVLAMLKTKHNHNQGTAD